MHARAQLFSPRSGKSNFRGHEVASAHLSDRARSVDRFPHYSGGVGNTNSQGVGRARASFTDYSLVRIHDYGKRFRTTAVDSNHQVLAAQSSR
jgi:hypothetical protein